MVEGQWLTACQRTQHLAADQESAEHEEQVHAHPAGARQARPVLAQPADHEALPRRWRWRAGGRGPGYFREWDFVAWVENCGLAYVLEAMLLAPPPAAGSWRWEGRWLLIFVVCLKNKNKIKSTPPQPSPCYAKGAGKSVSSTVRRKDRCSRSTPLPMPPQAAWLRPPATPLAPPAWHRSRAGR